MESDTPLLASRRLLQLAGILALLLIVLAVFAWMQGGGDASLNPIAQAAALTEESSGGRTSFRGTTHRRSLPHPIAFRGRGAFNGQTNRSQATLTTPTPTGTLEVQIIGSGSEVYMKSAPIQPRLPDGDEWLGVDASLGSASETAVGANSDPSAQLDLLRAVSDEFEVLGKKKIRGVETTGYRSTSNPGGYARYLRGKGSTKAARQYELLAEKVPSTTEIEAWIDGEKLIRRMTLNVTVQDLDSDETISTHTTVDFYDFGIFPEIDLPDPDTVHDVTPFVRAKLGLNGSS